MAGRDYFILKFPAKPITHLHLICFIIVGSLDHLAYESYVLLKGRTNFRIDKLKD